MFKNAWLVRSSLLLLFMAGVTAPAMAQRAVGLVAGVSATPDQFYIGGNIMAGLVAKDFWFRPSAEVGFGNNTTLVGLNGEFVYQVNLTKSPWTVYFGGGPALMIGTVHHDAPVRNNTDVGGGFNFLAGIKKSRGIFSEIKIGALDSPEFKFGVGYTF
jgi:hypothetical protein